MGVTGARERGLPADDGVTYLPSVPGAGPVVRPQVGRALLVACAVAAALSLVAVLVLLPDGTPVSADPGAPAVPIWVTVLPSLVGVGLVLVLPWRPPPLPAVPVGRHRLVATTVVLLALALLFPLAGGALGLSDETYLLAKVVLLMVLPATVVLVLRGAVRIEAPPAAWRWWAPLVVVAVWTLLSEVAPWNPVHDLSGIDPVLLVVAATATAVTAGLGEELFYRRWLQTRLEALLGPWPGIAVSTVLFGLMHLASHGTGGLWLDVARVLVLQGSFGLFMGVLWWRYRNLWLNVAAHVIVNGWAVAAAFARGDVAF